MNLAQFSARVKEIGKGIEVNMGKGVADIATAVNQTIILSTPVDTGHARGNWQIGLGSPVTSVIDGFDKDGGSTIEKNNAVIKTRLPGQDIVISNNVHYIGLLNAGSSAQAPAMFVQIAVREGIRAVSNVRLVR